jgi:rod shape-determining protein MreD
MLTILQNILSFVLLVLFQVLALNNVQFLGFINPYIYILFIIALPVKTPRWLSLILAFILGLTIDIFSNTLGMHAFATVLIAFLRNGIINLFIVLEENDNPVPSFRSFGVTAYIKYMVLMVFIHHFSLFFLEAFSFAHPILILSKITLSSLVTILILLGLVSLQRK